MTQHTFKPITEDTPVVWVDGKEITADHLQRWAYNQLESAAEMLAFIEKVAAWDFDVKHNMVTQAQDEAFKLIKKVRG